jgi:hypothetical protein
MSPARQVGQVQQVQGAWVAYTNSSGIFRVIYGNEFISGPVTATLKGPQNLLTRSRSTCKSRARAGGSSYRSTKQRIMLYMHSMFVSIAVSSAATRSAREPKEGTKPTEGLDAVHTMSTIHVSFIISDETIFWSVFPWLADAYVVADLEYLLCSPVLPCSS